MTGWGYYAIDKWAHRAEDADPSLRIRLDQLRKDFEDHKKNAETLRVERQARVDESLKRLDDRVTELHHKASDYGDNQQEAIGKIEGKIARLEGWKEAWEDRYKAIIQAVDRRSR